jgi:hypothetical protein
LGIGTKKLCHQQASTKKQSHTHMWCGPVEPVRLVE